MCLILFAYRVREDAPLVVAANRDEFYARPTDAARFWVDNPAVLAGRDRQAGGTWLGVNRHGRFAAVTNFREQIPGTLPPGSRGELAADFLSTEICALDYAEQVEPDRYRGFSLLLFDGNDLVCVSNRSGMQQLSPGVYGLANIELNCDWPKVIRGRAALNSALQADSAPTSDVLIELLGDRSVPADEHLPDTGAEIEFERRAAPCFIQSDEYGTRASTAVVITPDEVRFSEQSFESHGIPTARVNSNFAILKPAL